MQTTLLILLALALGAYIALLLGKGRHAGSLGLRGALELILGALWALTVLDRLLEEGRPAGAAWVSVGLSALAAALFLLQGARTLLGRRN